MTDNTSYNQLLFSLAVLILLSGITLLVYSNTFNAPFVFDDHHYIINDPSTYMNTLTFGSIKSAALEGRPKNRLLPNASFALNYYFNRFQVAGYHVVNIALHIITGIILFLFISRTLVLNGLPAKLPKQTVTPGQVAFLAALIWIIHPVNTQSVTYIYQRMTTMAALFFILSLLLYAWGRTKWRSTQRIDGAVILAFAGCMFSAVCAFISKQNAGMLPIIILIYEWFFFQNLSLGLSKKKIGWILVGIFIFTAVVILYLGQNPFDRILDAYSRREFTLIERIMTEWRVVIYYITLFFYPHPGRLNLDHDYPLSTSMVQPPTTAIALTAIFALAILAVCLARRHRLLAFCIIWFLINLVIESSVIGIEIIYEHRTYLPFMLLPIPALWLILRYIHPKKFAVGSILVVAIIFAAWTYQRNTAWNHPIAFAEDRVKKSPYKARPNMELGVYMAQQEEYKLAIHYLQKALSLNPNGRDMVKTYTNLGNVMAATGRLDKAVEYYQKSLALAPDDQIARENMEKVINVIRSLNSEP